MSLEQMSNRERILSALHNKETDRMPWSPLADTYFSDSLPQQGYDLDLIGALKHIGNDIMLRHTCTPEAIIKNVTTRIEKRGNITRKYLDTPVGSVYEDLKFSGKTQYIAKHMVTTLEDMKVFQYICDHTTYQPFVKEFIAVDQIIGDDGIAVLSGPTSPIQQLLQLVSGVEDTVYLQMDYEDEMEELFTSMHQRNKRLYDALMDYPCDVVFDYEDTSTTVMNKKMFLNDSMPYFNDYADICHEHDKLFITHMCGKLSGFSDLIAQGKQDGIDSVCPPTTGDLTAWDARKAFGDEKRIIGGIEPPSLVSLSNSEILENVIEIINKMDNKKGFILSTGDAVPYGTPMKYLTSITRLIKTLGPDSLKKGIDKDIIKHIIIS